MRLGPRLFDTPARDLADKMVPLETQWGALAERLHADVAAAADDDAAIVRAIEAALLARLAALGPRAICAVSAEFETMARADSTMRVADAAARFGLSVRRFERLCYASFGHNPKAILRRNRFLDMATAFRGFSDPSQDDLAALRYFDHSHRNREFRRFIGMTPGAFEKRRRRCLRPG